MANDPQTAGSRPDEQPDRKREETLKREEKFAKSVKKTPESPREIPASLLKDPKLEISEFGFKSEMTSRVMQQMNVDEKDYRNPVIKQRVDSRVHNLYEEYQRQKELFKNAALERVDTILELKDEDIANPELNRPNNFIEAMQQRLFMSLSQDEQEIFKKLQPEIDEKIAQLHARKIQEFQRHHGEISRELEQELLPEKDFKAQKIGEKNSFKDRLLQKARDFFKRKPPQFQEVFASSIDRQIDDLQSKKLKWQEKNLREGENQMRKKVKLEPTDLLNRRYLRDPKSFEVLILGRAEKVIDKAGLGIFESLRPTIRKHAEKLYQEYLQKQSAAERNSKKQAMQVVKARPEDLKKAKAPDDPAKFEKFLQREIEKKVGKNHLIFLQPAKNEIDREIKNAWRMYQQEINKKQQKKPEKSTETELMSFEEVRKADPTIDHRRYLTGLKRFQELTKLFGYKELHTKPSGKKLDRFLFVLAVTAEKSEFDSALEKAKKQNAGPQGFLATLVAGPELQGNAAEIRIKIPLLWRFFKEGLQDFGIDAEKLLEGEEEEAEVQPLVEEEAGGEQEEQIAKEEEQAEVEPLVEDEEVEEQENYVAEIEGEEENKVKAKVQPVFEEGEEAGDEAEESESEPQAGEDAELTEESEDELALDQTELPQTVEAEEEIPVVADEETDKELQEKISAPGRQVADEADPSTDEERITDLNGEASEKIPAESPLAEVKIKADYVEDAEKTSEEKSETLMEIEKTEQPSKEKRPPEEKQPQQLKIDEENSAEKTLEENKSLEQNQIEKQMHEEEAAKKQEEAKQEEPDTEESLKEPTGEAQQQAQKDVEEPLAEQLEKKKQQAKEAEAEAEPEGELEQPHEEQDEESKEESAADAKSEPEPEPEPEAEPEPQEREERKKPTEEKPQEEFFQLDVKKVPQYKESQKPQPEILAKNEQKLQTEISVELEPEFISKLKSLEIYLLDKKRKKQKLEEERLKELAELAYLFWLMQIQKRRTELAKINFEALIEILNELASENPAAFRIKQILDLLRQFPEYDTVVELIIQTINSRMQEKSEGRNI